MSSANECVWVWYIAGLISYRTARWKWKSAASNHFGAWHANLHDLAARAVLEALCLRRVCRLPYCDWQPSSFHRWETLHRLCLRIDFCTCSVILPFKTTGAWCNARHSAAKRHHVFAWWLGEWCAAGHWVSAQKWPKSAQLEGEATGTWSVKSKWPNYENLCGVCAYISSEVSTYHEQ